LANLEKLHFGFPAQGRVINHTPTPTLLDGLQLLSDSLTKLTTLSINEFKIKCPDNELPIGFGWATSLTRLHLSRVAGITPEALVAATPKLAALRELYYDAGELDTFLSAVAMAFPKLKSLELPGIDIAKASAALKNLDLPDDFNIFPYENYLSFGRNQYAFSKKQLQTFARAPPMYYSPI